MKAYCAALISFFPMSASISLTGKECVRQILAVSYTHLAALEVHVAEDAAAHNGQVRIAAAGVVGELRHKIEQLLKGAGRDGHGRMLMGEHDAVLVVIYIGAVLQIPGLSAERQRHHTCLLYTSPALWIDFTNFCFIIKLI